MCGTGTMQVCFKSTRNMALLCLALKLFVAYFLGPSCAQFFFAAAPKSLWQRQTEVPQCSSFGRVCVCERECCVCVLEKAKKRAHIHTHIHADMHITSALVSGTAHFFMRFT